MDLKENTNGIYSQKALVEKGKKLLVEGNKKFLEAKIWDGKCFWEVEKEMEWVD